MKDYIITLFDGKKEVPFKGLTAGEKVNLDNYNCRAIHPQDWQVFKNALPPKILDPEITSFLETGYEIRIYRKK